MHLVAVGCVLAILMVLAAPSWAGPPADPGPTEVVPPAANGDPPRSDPEQRTPRFEVNDDGTVTDTRTGLVWLEDASCAELPRTDDSGRAYGSTAILAAGDLAAPACGLADGSVAGDWRLPSRAELESVLDLGFARPALSNAAGSARWSAGDPFTGVETSYYWSSTPLAEDPTYVWCVDLYDGVVFYSYEVNYYYVWPVRDGGEPAGPGNETVSGGLDLLRPRRGRGSRGGGRGLPSLSGAPRRAAPSAR